MDRRWQAVAIVIGREKESGVKMSRKEYDELAAERNLGSGRALVMYVSAAAAGQPLTPKKPSGRRPNVLNQVNEFMSQQAVQFNYHFSHQVMGEATKGSLGVGSPSTVKRVLKSQKWRRVTQRIVPYLTQENQAQRFEFSRI